MHACPSTPKTGGYKGQSHSVTQSLTQPELQETLPLRSEDTHKEKSIKVVIQLIYGFLKTNGEHINT